MPARDAADERGWAVGADLLLGWLAWLRTECAPRRRPRLELGPEPQLCCHELGGGTEEFERLYRLGEKIGQGAFGKVFACEDLRRTAAAGSAGSDGPLCVKVVPLRGRHVSRAASLCEEEKRLLLCQFLRMEHPNIVKYHSFIQTGDALYTVMERCCGLDLVDYVKEQGDHLPNGCIRNLALQVLSAVAAVHAVGLMHRDIKPENFRFKDLTAAVLQLLDFGFAKPAPRTSAPHSVTGTLLYAAPEVFDGVYCPKCDLWSTGVVFFQLFAGHPPFQTSNVGILRSLHRDPMLTGAALFRGEAWRQAPREARGLIRGLLTLDPVARLSAAEASAHPWLFQVQGAAADVQGGAAAEPWEEEEEADDHPATRRSTLKKRSSSLRRDASSISVHGDAEAAELKRSYFVWDLASAAAATGSGEFEGSTEDGGGDGDGGASQDSFPPADLAAH